MKNGFNMLVAALYGLLGAGLAFVAFMVGPGMRLIFDRAVGFWSGWGGLICSVLAGFVAGILCWRFRHTEIDDPFPSFDSAAESQLFYRRLLVVVGCVVVIAVILWA
jgi:hypothetical protein